MAERIETGSDQSLFIIDRLNMVNNADEDTTNPMGMALFANSVDVVRKLDLEYDSYASHTPRFVYYSILDIYNIGHRPQCCLPFLILISEFSPCIIL